MVKSKKTMRGLDCVDYKTQVFTEIDTGFDVIQLACPRKGSMFGFQINIEVSDLKDIG